MACNDQLMEKYRSLSPDLFLAEIALTTDAILLDVRTRDEIWQDPMIDGAVNMDFLEDHFEYHLEEMDRMRPYFIYCSSGKRGRMVCQLMADRGFLLTSYLEGGKAAWDEIFKEVN